MQKTKQTGFTIIELLIVIVVIGILAAITIVAYNGLQERARMATAKAFEAQFRSKYLVDATGEWSFDECSGSSVANRTLGAADAIAGGVSWITDTATGSGCALRFDGTTHIETKATTGARFYAKGAWVRISTATCGSDNIISQAAINGSITALYTDTCYPRAGNNGAWSTTQSPKAINDNKWHYVATDWVDGVQKLYVDGVIVSSANNPAALQVPNGYVSIGSYMAGNNMLGDIDNPFIAAGN